MAPGTGEAAESDGAEGNPLPRAYVTDTPGVGGTLKVRPEDFIVEELPLYPPSGEGEHLYLVVRKTSVSHQELMSVLRRHYRVPERAIGFAGMKDKHAVTHQMVSIHLPGDERAPVPDLPHERIDVLGAARHRNKLRRGHLAGNRFSIRLRDIDPMRAPSVQRTMQALERTGIPCYFGDQRFGYRHNNHLLGAAILREEWEAAARELLGATGTPYPEHQNDARRRFDDGRYADAAPLWTAADRAEGIAIKRLARGSTPEEALAAIGVTTLRFWVSACMSAIFNRLLDARITAGCLDRLVAGDLAWKHDSRAVFRVTPSELASGALDERLARFEISPSGPLWGARMMRAEGDVDAVECAALDDAGITLEQCAQSRYAEDGARRPYRVGIGNVDVEGGIDEHGGFVRVVFDLPRGMYATVVMREVMKGSWQPGD